MMMQPAGIGREKIFLSIISGVALTIGFPVVGFSYAAWFALVFLLFAIRNTSVRHSIVLGGLTGMVHFAALLYWLVETMHIYGYLPLWLSVVLFIPLVFYLSLYVAAFAGMVRVFCSGSFFTLFLIPVFWVCLEYVRSFAFTGFPWGLIGYTQVAHLNLIQISDIFGVYGVSFVIVLANAVIFFGLLRLQKEKWQGCDISTRQVIVSFAMMASVFALVVEYGNVRLQSTDKMMSESEKLNVAVVQGNIEQSAKWDLAFRMDTIEKYIRLSEQAGKSHPDLIVWPETATPFYFKYNIEMTKMVLQAIRTTKTHFVVGSPTVEFAEPQEYYYNSAYLVTPDGDIAARNDKVHLVPFGEYVPLKKWLPFINHLVAQVGEFRAGKKGDTLKWAPADIGVLICYEVIFPELARECVSNHAGLLVNITNDAWFGNTSAPYQHFSMAVFRAIENRRSLIRAANTGISGFIDPAGRLLSQTGLFEEAVMTYSVPVIKKYTSIYTGYGNLLVLGCFIILAFIIMIKLAGQLVRKKVAERK
jgi:apolipoprotein N-acyltransferase